MTKKMDVCHFFPPAEVKPADFRSAVKVTIARPKGESKEEKKARKSALKEEKRNRRAEKKATRTEFTAELKKQQDSAAQKEKSRMKKL
jgi:protein LTV1